MCVPVEEMEGIVKGLEGCKFSCNDWVKLSAGYFISKAGEYLPSFRNACLQISRYIEFNNADIKIVYLVSASVNGRGGNIY